MIEILKERIVCDRCGFAKELGGGHIRDLFSRAYAEEHLLRTLVSMIRRGYGKSDLQKRLEELKLKLFNEVRYGRDELEGWQCLGWIHLCPECSREFDNLLKDFFAARLVSETL